MPDTSNVGSVDSAGRERELEREVSSLTAEVADLQRFTQEYMIKAANEKVKVRCDAGQIALWPPRWSGDGAWVWPQTSRSDMGA